MMMVLLKSLVQSNTSYFSFLTYSFFDHIDTVTIVNASLIGKFLLISLGAETYRGLRDMALRALLFRIR